MRMAEAAMEQTDYDLADAWHRQAELEEQQMETTPQAEPTYRPINEIAKALAAAQAEMTNPTFDARNPHFSNRFASLAAVRNATVPILAKHGISMNQDLKTTDKGISCTTILTHSSGQYMYFGPLVMPASKPDAQGLGSAATYARRYSLMAVCGVVGDDDDDANSATGKPGPATKPGPVHSPLGEVAPNDGAIAYADAIKEAIGDAIKIGEIHADLHEEGEEMYRAVWSLLDSKTRSTFKKIVEQKKAAA